MSVITSSPNIAAVAGPPIAQQLLTALADGRLHTAPELARSLGLNHRQLQDATRQLTDQGLMVRRHAGQGLSLPEPLELLEPTRIEASLPAAWRKQCGGLDVLWRPGSTSDEARKRLARAADGQLVVVAAESQAAGRGRRGKVWLAPPGTNICVSVGRRMACADRPLAGLSLAMGVQLAHLVTELGCKDVALKWPNDLLLGGAKLAGVLVEAGIRAGGPAAVVVGVGLNLRMPAAIAHQAGQPVADLATALGGNVASRNQIMGAVIGSLAEGLDRFATHGFAAFADAYRELDALRGKSLAMHTAQGCWQGVGAGISGQGALRVRHGSEERIVDSADVSVRAA